MPGKILIIEDEENITRFLKVNLVGAGFTVEDAATGEEGLEKASSLMPDIVIVDLRLPGISGWEVCRKLKMDPKYKNMTVVILTASDQKYTREQAASLGIDAFFSKPVDIHTLVKKMKELVRKK